MTIELSAVCLWIAEKSAGVCSLVGCMLRHPSSSSKFPANALALIGL